MESFLKNPRASVVMQEMLGHALTAECGFSVG